MKKISEFTIITINDKLNIDVEFTKESIDYLALTHTNKFGFDDAAYDYNQVQRYDNEMKYRRKVRDMARDIRIFTIEFKKTDILKIKKYHNNTIQIFCMPNDQKYCIAKSGSKTITIKDRIEKKLICGIFERAFVILHGPCNF